jgi:hypothetical protein
MCDLREILSIETQRRSAKKSSERLTKGRGFRAPVVSEDIATWLGATVGMVASTCCGMAIHPPVEIDRNGVYSGLNSAFWRLWPTT